MGWLALPEVCSSCGESSDAGFCSVCRNTMSRVAVACARCGLPPGAPCPRQTSPWVVTRVRAPFAYAPPLDRFLLALKYRGRRTLGRAAALLLAAELGREAFAVDALVPVPLHPRRLRERGYNQSVEIARTLGRALRLPVLVRGFARRAATPTQTGQSAAERFLNVREAFVVSRAVAGMRLAIVDDVITTGATVNALAGCLIRAGAEPPEAWAVARTL